MADAESDWETDEETNVVVKLTGAIRDDFIKNMSTEKKPKCSAMGLLTDEPLLQLGSDLFKGTYSHPAGTHLLLKEVDKESQSAGKISTELQFLCTSDKQIDMNKLYVIKKTEQAEASSQENGDEPMECSDTPAKPLSSTSKDKTAESSSEGTEPGTGNGEPNAPME